MRQKLIKIFKDKPKVRIKLIVILCALFLSTSVICFSYYFTQGSFSGSQTITIKFGPKINESTNYDQTVSLSDTITNDKNLGPGAEGKFKMDIDFTDVINDAYYKVYYDSTGVPINLKFYVDEDYTTELDFIEGIELNSNNDKLAEHFIYWKWIYDNSENSNNNDNLFMNTEINVLFTAYVSQNIESNTIIVNEVEKPTGRIELSNQNETNGSFDLNLDFSNLSLNDQYRVYFSKKELSNNLHLYSDSLYQNEINYLSGSFDGNNTSSLNTIYWKLDNDNASVLSDGLYYVTVLGSW